MRLLHFIRASLVVAVTAATAFAQQAPPAPPAPTSRFVMFLRATQIGTEDVAVARSETGWTIASFGRSGPPLDLVIRNLQIRYDPDWKPLELTLDGTVRGQPYGVHVGVAGTAASVHATGDAQPQAPDRVDTIAADAVLLPNPFFAAYEAVAARLKTFASGSTIPAYAIAAVPMAIRVGDSVTERIQTVARLIEARRTYLALAPAASPELPVDVWSDESGRLLRVSIPSQSLEFVRDDIASVATRRVTISRTGDEAVRIPANGFNLTGTLSKPSAGAGRRAAIVLVAGSGPQDRDETVAGVPVFGQLASALADAGFFVLRYDKRGVGQSGGRTENAALSDYTDDLRAAVKFLSDRKDVDPKRIAVVGHSEGGAVALMEAARNDRVATAVLLAAPGSPGTDLILTQQKHLLDRSNLSDADKQARIDLQMKIHEAVVSGKGWEALPAEVRRAAQNAEFQSILTFDPSKVIPRVRQPLLIVQGLLDTQVEPANADRLEALARARKRPAPVEVVRIPGVNHLFLPATTGEVEEYARLTGKELSPELPAAIVAWLNKTLK